MIVASIDQSALRDVLSSDPRRGVAELAEVASRVANDRDILYRAILLRREIARIEGPVPTAHVNQGLELLEQLVADQSDEARPIEDRRSVRAEQARGLALSLRVPNEVVVECAAVSKAYRRGDFALRDVSLDVRFGEIVGIVGLNGNGKTTLFRLIVGELAADVGAVTFPAFFADDRKVSWPTVWRHIAYVPQELPKWHGSLRCNLHYEAAIHGIRGDENELEVAYIAERLGIASELDKRWHQLSGGNRLRFALARALVSKPKLLVLDEPLANLDFLAQQVVLTDLRHLTDSLRYPLAVLVSSQHVHEIEEVSDRLLVLESGRAKYFGPVDAIGANRVVNRFEIGGEFGAHEIRAALDGLDYQSVHYTGVAFVATTSTRVTAPDVLGCLTSARLPITYFRDISHSAKGLLQDGDQP